MVRLLSLTSLTVDFKKSTMDFLQREPTSLLAMTSWQLVGPQGPATVGRMSK